MTARRRHYRSIGGPRPSLVSRSPPASAPGATRWTSRARQDDSAWSLRSVLSDPLPQLSQSCPDLALRPRRTAVAIRVSAERLEPLERQPDLLLTALRA